jgi:hypothetical protein
LDAGCSCQLLTSDGRAERPDVFYEKNRPRCFMKKITQDVFMKKITQDVFMKKSPKM